MQKLYGKWFANLCKSLRCYVDGCNGNSKHAKTVAVKISQVHATMKNKKMHSLDDWHHMWPFLQLQDHVYRLSSFTCWHVITRACHCVIFYEVCKSTHHVWSSRSCPLPFYCVWQVGIILTWWRDLGLLSYASFFRMQHFVGATLSPVSK